MASYNVFFAVDVDCRSGELGLWREGCLKRWILRVLLCLGTKYGFEKVRWGYRFLYSRTVKSASRITRGADFRELNEKAFSDFEDELGNLGVPDRPSEDQPRPQSSPASCLHSALKDVLLDFQWDRPDITSPTKLSLRPRRSCRSTNHITLAEDELSCVGKNVLFVVSACPHSKQELEEFLHSSVSESHKDLTELVLPKRLIELLAQRRVVLHWADCSLYKGAAGSDFTGLKTVTEVLQLVAGKVVPVLTPWFTLKHSQPNIMDDDDDPFLIASSISYILASEKTYQSSFPALEGTLCWGADGNKQICGVLFEPVSCSQRLLSAPVEVTLKTVLQGFNTSFIHQSSSECWVMLCPDKPEQHQHAFQCLLKELSVEASDMLAEVSEGGLVQSAVLSVLSPHSALLTVLQPMVTQCAEVLNRDHVSSETTENSSDLPDIVSSVLNMMYDTKDENSSEEIKQLQVPEWATLELQQWTDLTKALTEGWFCLSDQSGVSCHLMESMRLLHAAPEEQEQTKEYTQLEVTHSLAELYQSSRVGAKTGPNDKKKGAQRTPVRQKMKTMSRSLQMLNVARFNVKEQKSQAEVDLPSTTRGTEKRCKRRSGERAKSGPMHFKSEEELFSHLKLTYQQAVEDCSLSLHGQVQNLLSVVKAFIKSNTENSFLDLIKKKLLKSSQSVRKQYRSAPDTESKIRDCQLQVVLRLEVCRQPSSGEDPDDVEQMVEEMADMLRIISLTKDPVFMSKFMQEDILPLYLKDLKIPKVLADIYHSLGTQLPEVLVAVLPSDFFSDDSMTKNGVSVSPSSLSATQSMVSSAGNRLEDLRNNSAKKRRTSRLSRHKSMTEATQTLRQIEVPRKSTRKTKQKMCNSSEKRNVGSLPPQKQTVQEVTKVRRNLFNQEMGSPSKKVKMPRSQSVSALEGMKKRKRSLMEKEQPSLLTKKVSETPLHKQVSNRLLQRQKSGRRSGDDEMVIIEESPIKPAADLRRSPRIKSLARRHSSVFYSSSQPRSRNFDRALSSSQLISESKGGIHVGAVKSPVRLLFGAAQSPVHSSTSWKTRDNGKNRLESTASVFENFNKTPRKSLYNSPHKSGSAVRSRTPRTPTSSSKAQGSPISKSPGHTCGENGMILRGSPFRSPAAKGLILETPKKSPLKSILRTPLKSFVAHGTHSGSSHQSPSMRTPKKSVTWSPSPRKCWSEKPFKVPDSPQNNRFSPVLITPTKSCRFQGEDFKTPDKLPTKKGRISPKTQKLCEPNEKSKKMRRTLSLSDKAESQSPKMLSIDHLSPATPEITTPRKDAELTCSTRSGNTPLKSVSAFPSQKSKFLRSNSLSPCKDASMPVTEKPSRSVLRSPTSRRNSRIPPDHFGVKSAHSGGPCNTKTVSEQNAESTKGMIEEGSSSDSQQCNSSQCSATTTDESIDIADASVVKTELTGGIKMNISYSRKSSKSGVFEFTGTSPVPTKDTQGRSYGFRQTPDRQQRRAAARLGYSPALPKFSTPRGSGTPAHGKKPAEPNPLTYEVELEMQASGLPKLKFKRTDSFNSGEATEGAAMSMVPHVMNSKVSRVDSPLTHCSKHREPACIPPSLCAHETPGKGGVQTYICQSVTPTRLPNNSPPPLGAGENMPWTPSPQKRGWSTPENLNSWPRKKRARTGVSGTKENPIKGEVEVLEDPELDGVFRLAGTEDLKESWTPVSKYKLVASPPGSKVKKPVSVSGILALTQSPLLYKGAKATVTQETKQSDAPSGNSEQFGNKSVFTTDGSPFSQPRKRQGCGRTHSRKRLLEP